MTRFYCRQPQGGTMPFAIRFLLLLVLSSVCRAATPPTVDVDANGMLRALVDWPREITCRGGIWIVRDDWKSVRQQWELKEIERSPFADERTIRGHFETGEARVELHESFAPSSIAYRVRSSKAIDVTGVFWCLELPVSVFAGGSAIVDGNSFPLAADKPATAQIGGATGRSITFVSRDGGVKVTATFAEPRELRLQDARPYGDDRYQIMTPLAESTLAADQELKLDVSLAIDAKLDASPAIITLDPKTIRSDFDGFGGNFVYAIDDPVTDLALKSLKLTWARIGVEAAKWEPTNDNDDPKLTAVSALAARDVEGSALRRRFELDQRLHKLAGGRLIASLWYPPEWLFETPMAERTTGGTIPRDRWDELAECVTSYLLHLKTRYGVEPLLFSFNESDIGIYVLLNGEETRDLTKLLGERFEQAGLRTKLLLGDSADLDKGLQQIRPTLDDPDARKHVGALAYHPWMGQNEHWPVWSGIAERHGLMLMATEMGADATAWQDGSFNSPLQTLRLARRYIEQLRDAGTQVLLEWEWTGDYAIAERDAKGTLELTRRGAFLQQFTQTTPTQSLVIGSTCDASTITAAALLADDRSSLAVHLLNAGAARRVEIRGIPDGFASATLHVVDPIATDVKPIQVTVKSGVCAVDLPAGAIATLAFSPPPASR